MRAQIMPPHFVAYFMVRAFTPLPSLAPHDPLGQTSPAFPPSFIPHHTDVQED